MDESTNLSDLDKVRSDGLKLSECVDPSEKIVLEAIKENKYAFRYVNLDILTNRFVDKLLYVCRSLVVELPLSYVTKKRLLRAVNEDASILEQFSDDHFEYVTGKELLRMSHKAYDYIKPSYIDDDLCRYAVVRHPVLYRKIPDIIKTKSFNRYVCQLVPKLICEISELHINRKLVRIVLERDPDVQYLLPKQWQQDYAGGISGNDSNESDIKEK